MNISLDFKDQFDILKNTIHFFKRHFLVIMVLGLIAAFGRVIQLGGFGPVSSTLNIILEVVVEAARLTLFLFVLGLANIRSGIARIQRLFINKDNRSQLFKIAFQKFKKQWLAVLMNLVGFLLIAFVINYLIDALAYETCLYLNLKREGLLAAAASEWTILLFFKNLTVIPLTLIFDTLLLLWLANKMTNSKKLNLT